MPLYDWIYTDLHSLNLDWIIKKMKQLEILVSASGLETKNIVPSLADLLAQEWTEGDYIQTLGFTAPGDFGDALYQAGPVSPAFVVDNCRTFRSNEGRIIERIYTGAPLFLESMNYKNVAWSTILAEINANKIHKVYASQIEPPYPIEIKDFDFFFDKITYTGTDAALILDSVVENNITGNWISAKNGTGIRMKCSSRNCTSNILTINRIEADICIAVLPTDGHGIMWNEYNIEYMKATSYGFYTFIANNAANYSWEGEENLSLNQIQASNDAGTAHAVHLEIEPDVDNSTQGGTITGLTFQNLAVEYSDIGLYMRNGTVLNAFADHVKCIKSIEINNMRVREKERTAVFLDLAGWMQDINIHCNSAILWHQWKINNTGSYSRVYIEAPVYNPGDTQRIAGYNIIGISGKTCIQKCAYGEHIVDSATGFDSSLIKEKQTTAPDIFLPRFIRIGNDVTNAQLDLSAYWYATEDDLIITAPPGNWSYKFCNGTWQNVNNSSNNRHMYLLKCYARENIPTQNYYTLIDLGASTIDN